METILSVRLDTEIKRKGTQIMRQHGMSPSQAVRKLFEVVNAENALPFSTAKNNDKDEVLKRIKAFDACHTKKPLTLTDDELRAERVKERYEIDA